MLTDWLGSRYPLLGVAFDDQEDAEALQIRSPRTGTVVRLTVTCDQRYEPPPAGPGAQGANQVGRD